MTEPRTLGELLARLDGRHGAYAGTNRSPYEALEALDRDLRRIIYGTDTEPGMVERIATRNIVPIGAPEPTVQEVFDSLRSEIGTPERSDTHASKIPEVDDTALD